jgi:hypothetical protein
MVLEDLKHVKKICASSQRYNAGNDSKSPRFRMLLTERFGVPGLHFCGES